MERRRIVLGLSLAFALSCATNPATGKSQIMLVSESQEIEIGRQEAAKVVKSMPSVGGEPEALVRRIGMAMAAKSERPNLPWEFHLLDDETVNAFALPGGFIFITRGIMTYMNNEAELASVIGHEIGHVTGRHSAQQMTNAQLGQVGLVAGMILSPTVREMGGALTQGMQLLFLKFGRDDESEADVLGFRYMSNDGYDTRAAASMFETLERTSGSGSERLPEWQSTHPDPENRVRNALRRVDSVEARGQDLSGSTLNADSYMRMLDGMVFGTDPVKQGYVRNGVFYHPELRMQFAFPEGWRTQNRPEGVIAVSPQQDAAMQFAGAAGAGQAQEAAQKFFGQQGLQTANLNTSSINGLPAASGDFRAQLQDGRTVDGTASFIELGNTTYMFMGYGKQGTSLDPMKSAIRSFKPLTDRRFIDVSPARNAVVKVPRDMTVEQFARQYPSSIPVQQLAVINGVDSTTSILKAGRLAKRVVGGSN